MLSCALVALPQVNSNYAPAAPAAQGAERVLHGLTAQRAGVLGSAPPERDPSFVVIHARAAEINPVAYPL